MALAVSYVIGLGVGNEHALVRSHADSMHV